MIRTYKINALLKTAMEEGVDVDSMLADVSLFHNHSVDRPDMLIDEKEAVAILLALAEHCTVDFPLRNGARLRQLDLGIVGHALLSAPTMSDLIEIWVKYSDVIGHPLRTISRIEGNYWILELVPRFPMPQRVLRFVLENTLSMHVPLGRETLNRPYEAIRYEVTIPPHSDQALYPQWIPAPVTFNCRQNRIIVDKVFYDMPVETADSEVLQLCEKHCANIIKNINGDMPIASDVKSLFLRFTGKLPNEKQAAAELGLSVRTLHRKLAKEGYSFQQLLNDYRKDYTLHLLKEDSLQVKEISYLLGYQSSNSLRRAFKEWTGSTISDWLSRERAQNINR